MRRTYHQLDPKRFGQKTFEKLPFREDVKGEKYEDGGTYRARAYPNEYFVWHTFDAKKQKLPGNEGVKGEWQIGTAELD
jgi:hypothetical protein